MKLLSHIYLGIQRMLLPALNEEMGELSAKEKRFVAICEATRLEAFMEPCGWENGPNEVPDETTFSRAFAHFAQLGLGAAVHEKLISDHLGDQTIWHSATDATAIQAREKPCAETTIPAPMLNGGFARGSLDAKKKRLTLTLAFSPQFLPADIPRKAASSW